MLQEQQQEQRQEEEEEGGGGGGGGGGEEEAQVQISKMQRIIMFLSALIYHQFGVLSICS